jgi:hypothetical protein
MLPKRSATMSTSGVATMSRIAAISHTTMPPTIRLTEMNDPGRAYARSSSSSMWQRRCRAISWPVLVRMTTIIVASPSGWPQLSQIVVGSGWLLMAVSSASATRGYSGLRPLGAWWQGHCLPPRCGGVRTPANVSQIARGSTGRRRCGALAARELRISRAARTSMIRAAITPWAELPRLRRDCARATNIGTKAGWLNGKS